MQFTWLECPVNISSTILFFKLINLIVLSKHPAIKYSLFQKDKLIKSSSATLILINNILEWKFQILIIPCDVSNKLTSLLYSLIAKLWWLLVSLSLYLWYNSLLLKSYDLTSFLFPVII